MDVLRELTALANKSLLRSEQNAYQETHFRLLETIRAYCLERLSQDFGNEEEAVRQGHAEICLDFVKSQSENLDGVGSPLAMRSLLLYQSNIHDALTWLQTHATEGEAGFELIFASARFWERIGYFQEGSKLIALFLDGFPTVNVAYRVRAIKIKGVYSWRQGVYAQAWEELQSALMLCERENVIGQLAPILTNLGNLAREMRKFDEAADFLLRSLALDRANGDNEGVAINLNALGYVECERKAYTKAREYLNEALDIQKKANRRIGEAYSLDNLGWANLEEGYLGLAERNFTEALAIYEVFFDTLGVARSEFNLGRLAQKRNNPTQALSQFQSSLRVFNRMQALKEIHEAFLEIAFLIAAESPSDAVFLLGATDCLRRKMQISRPDIDKDGDAPELQALRSGISPEAFFSLWEEGLHAPLEDAASKSLTITLPSLSAPL